MSHFALQLNYLTKAQMMKIAPTDSRNRPDIRQLEKGNLDEAANEKMRMEEKQREAKSERLREKKDYHPTYFQKEYKKQNLWLFKEDSRSGGAREAGDWS